VARTEITPVEIARLAGVGRAAVSNWRRRYRDFPGPVAGTATSPRFGLAEVAAWLRRHGKLAELPADELAWQELRAGASEHELPEATRRAGELLLSDSHRDAGPLAQALAELAAARGTAGGYELLLDRLHEATRLPRLPAEVADLMAALAGSEPGSVYDPACGAGGLLLAARARFPAARLAGDEADPALLGLARVRLAAHRAADPARLGSAGLRQPPDPPQTADAVLCAPLYAERGWAGDDLAYDPRWEYGLPPKLEPELAWVQHALANLRPGGRAVLLLPPAVAARPSGRRIRAELLRRGALRAVIGLPPGAAPPHNLALHLWVLRRPPPSQPADRLLVADLSAGRQVEPAELASALAVLDAGGDLPPSLAGRARLLPVTDLLDEAVDLTPARRLPTSPAPVDGATLLGLRDEFRAQLGRLAELLPELTARSDAAPLPTITVAELARTGAVQILHGGLRGETDSESDGGVPVWRARDVLAGHGPATRLPADQVPDDAERLVPGDVVAPAIGHRLVARVVTDAEAGTVLGANLYLLRPDPQRLDSWFLAGFLRRELNTRRTGSLGSIQRYDIRRAQVPRVPVGDQRRHGVLFRRLADFEDLLRRTGETGGAMLRLVADSLAAGSLQPPF
jgi:hypothetical protein